MIFIKNRIILVYNNNKEIILYLIFGVLTTVVNLIAYLIFVWLFGINYIIGNILAWLFAVSFAYITNKIWVFESTKNNIITEFLLFMSGRILSGVIDSCLLYLFVEIFFWSDLISKIIIQIIVVILNYLISKLIVFKK